jgi:hypothetical protein
MPHYESIPAIEDIAPEDLLPKTPKRGPKPPVQKVTEPEKLKNHRLLPRISIQRYRPAVDTDRLMDDMLQEIVE